MIPAHFFDGGESGEMYGDRTWLIDQLNQLSRPVRELVSKKYSKIYQELTLSDPHKCRFRANSWLRKTVKKNKNNDVVPF